MAFLRTLTCGVAVALLAVACGGASGNEDLFSGSTSGSSSGGSSGSTSGSLPPTDGGTLPPVDGAIADGTIPETGGPDARPDGPIPPVEAGSGDPGIYCGTNPDCTVGSQVCCRTTTLNGATFACTPNGACGPSLDKMQIPCDDAHDCALLGSGAVCCATYKFDTVSQKTTVIQVACAAADTCSTQNNAVVMCDPNAPDPCPNGGSCKTSQQTFPGYHLCI